MLTTEEIKAMHASNEPAGGRTGKWRREFVKRAQLARRVGGYDLKCFVTKKGGLVEWDVRSFDARFTLGFGSCTTWEQAMADAETFTRMRLTQDLGGL